MSVTSRQCAKCHWYHPIGPRAGECYNLPPTVVAAEYRIVTVRPEVQDNETCSKWTQKENV